MKDKMGQISTIFFLMSFGIFSNASTTKCYSLNEAYIGKGILDVCIKTEPKSKGWNRAKVSFRTENNINLSMSSDSYVMVTTDSADACKKTTFVLLTPKKERGIRQFNRFLFKDLNPIKFNGCVDEKTNIERGIVELGKDSYYYTARKPSKSKRKSYRVSKID